MKQSRLFTKTRKDAPKDEVSKNAQLLIRAGFIHKEFAGVYSLLPLGVRVIDKISNIIRQEMDAIGGVEMQSAALQQKSVWGDRWSDNVVDNWFKTKLNNGTDLGLAFTHEEPSAAMMKNYISSYKDLPVYPYDVRTVFRNEARAKSGLMRGREFFWKALYSFSKNIEEHNEFYEKSKTAYKNIFDRVGIGHLTHITFASGGSFAKYSHEFQTISDAGEDIVYIDENSGVAVNKEVLSEETLKELGFEKDSLIEKKAIETGNIFSLSDKFSKPAGLKFKDEQGKEQFVYMGSYGIGISRLMGTVAEVLSDENGLVWPESIAPFKIHILTFGKNENIFREAESLYYELKNSNIEVLFDDRDMGPGQKMNDADLMGIPYRIVLSEKSMENGGIEIKNRQTGSVEIIDIDRAVSYFLDK